jgi:hypothetical protein
MAGYPLICERCAGMFDHPGFVVGGEGLTIDASQGPRIGPHPGCGGYGRPAATWIQLTKDGVRAALAEGLGVEQEQVVAQMLEQAHGDLTLEQLEHIIETGPEWLRAAAARLPESSNPDERRFLLTILLTVLGIVATTSFGLLAHHDADVAHQDAVQAHADAKQATQTSNPGDAEIERLVEAAIKELRVRRHSPKAGAAIGRNHSCPCGSGKRYKNCHGRAERHPRARR